MRRLTPDSLHSDARPMLVGERAPVVNPATVASIAAEVNAPDELELAFEAARERGHAEGLREAESEIAARVGQLENKLREAHKAALEQVEADRERLRALALAMESGLIEHARASEEMSIEVAYASLIRVLGDAAVERTLIADLCRTIVREYGHPPATLRVSDLDLPLLESVEFGIPVEGDRRLSSGQCVIDTARGQFEGGLDVRLDALTRSLLGTLAAHRGGA